MGGTVVTEFNVKSWHLFRLTEENYDKLQSQYPVTTVSFEPQASKKY